METETNSLFTYQSRSTVETPPPSTPRHSFQKDKPPLSSLSKAAVIPKPASIFKRDLQQLNKIDPEIYKTYARPPINSPKAKSYHSFVMSDPKSLKVKMFHSNHIFALKLRKDRLTSINDLIKVISSKVVHFDRLSLCFQDKTLTPLPFNDFFNDLIMDYVLNKETIYVMAF